MGKTPEFPLRRRDSRGGRKLAWPEAPEPLPSPVYDNHTHIEFADGDRDLDPFESLDLAARVGVQGIMQVGTDVETSRWGIELATADERVLAAVALHPNEAPVLSEQGLLSTHLSEIARLATHPRVAAIGETGLDFYRTGEDGREAQFESFEAHVEIAKEQDLPLQIHNRDATAEVIATLERVGAPAKTVMHCFSETEEIAAQCAEHGWYLSFAGTATFKNAEHLRRAARVTPLNRILVETDAPFLTPEPYRGRPNAPYLLPHTV